MWNVISAYALALDASPRWWDTWVGSWWDMSSFGPDALIGIGTGLIVALIVLGAERRLAGRARGLEVSNAQGAVVEKARRVLTHEVAWPEKGFSFHPDRTQLDRLVPTVTAVPSGDPLEHLPGFHHAQRVVEVLEEVAATADAVSSYTRRHEWNEDLLAIPDAIESNIRGLLDAPVPLQLDWAWTWPQDHWRPIPTSLKQSVEDDQDLRQAIGDYVRSRRLLEAHRQAFLTADGSWRADEWAALVARTFGVPHNFIKALYRKRKYDKAVSVAKRKAESRANELIIAVDPMAY